MASLLLILTAASSTDVSTAILLRICTRKKRPCDALLLLLSLLFPEGLQQRAGQGRRCLFTETDTRAQDNRSHLRHVRASVFFLHCRHHLVGVPRRGRRLVS